MGRIRYSIVRHSDAQSVELLYELHARFRRLDVERLPRSKSGRWCVYVTTGPDITHEPLRLAAIGDTLPDAARRMILMCQGVEDDA